MLPDAALEAKVSPHWEPQVMTHNVQAGSFTLRTTSANKVEQYVIRYSDAAGSTNWFLPGIGYDAEGRPNAFVFHTLCAAAGCCHPDAHLAAKAALGGGCASHPRLSGASIPASLMVTAAAALPQPASVAAPLSAAVVAGLREALAAKLAVVAQLQVHMAVASAEAAGLEAALAAANAGAASCPATPDPSAGHPGV